MRRTTSWRVCLLALASCVFVASHSAVSLAGESQSFIVPASDGYGVQDCLGGEGDCGQVVADAWCEAHGHGAALAFGKTDDVTGAIKASVTPKMPAGAYFVTCGE
jgi:hypothetical protein